MSLFYTKNYLKSIQLIVKKELEAFNLYTNIKVYSSFLDSCRGYFTNGKKPHITLCQLSLIEFVIPLLNTFVSSYVKTNFYSDGSNMIDILRHEYGHAYSESHIKYKCFRKKFNKIFGNFNSKQHSRYDPLLHISEYASKEPDEDFSECFMYFLKWKGKWKDKNLPGEEYINGTYNKLKFIESLTK